MGSGTGFVISVPSGTWMVGQAKRTCRVLAGPGERRVDNDAMAVSCRSDAQAPASGDMELLAWIIALFALLVVLFAVPVMKGGTSCTPDCSGRVVFWPASDRDARYVGAEDRPARPPTF